MAKLSDSQLVVLSSACQRPDRSVYPITAKLPGGALAKVLTSLLSKKLIKEFHAGREDTVSREDKKRGRLTLRATPAAVTALGIEDDGAKEASAAEEAKTPTKAKPKATKSSRPKPSKAKASKRVAKPGKVREGTKQARLIEMLKRSKGATIEEIVKAFDWQAHTVRGAMAGALKKKLGLKIESEQIERRGRVYRIKA